MDGNTREENRQALDAFAQATASPALAPSVRPLAGPIERVFGAQAVAVYRDEARILQKLSALAAAAGDAWYYRFPVKKKGGGQDWIEGPSIKLANDVARIYGNCDVDVRVIDLGDTWLFYARFTDFETGYSLTRPFQQRKSQRGMNTDNERALDIAFQIGASKAIRNVVANALQTFADHAFEEARNSLVEKIGKNLDTWRTRTVEAIARMPAELVRVERVMGRASKDWTAPDVAKVIAMMKAIADGMATIDETFPVINAASGDDGEGEAAKTSETEATQSKPKEPAAGEAAKAADAQPQQGEQAKQAETKPAADKAATEKPAEGKGKPDFVPTTETEYVGFANAWRDQVTDPAAGRQRWKDEKNVRNKANVTAETRDDLKQKLDAKCADLEKADA